MRLACLTQEQMSLRVAGWFAALWFASTAMSAATEVDGVTLPDKQDVAGVHFQLNGTALRTYSVFGVHVYIAGLYLQRRLTDPEAILSSDGPKLLHFVFLHDVDAGEARDSWHDTLQRNCSSSCGVAPASIAQFVASVPAVHRGDTSTFLFTPHSLDIFLNGRQEGRITDPKFMNLILRTFIGPNPTSEEVKLGLLGAPR
jgi:hypothetical protein